MVEGIKHVEPEVHPAAIFGEIGWRALAESQIPVVDARCGDRSQGRVAICAERRRDEACGVEPLQAIATAGDIVRIANPIGFTIIFQACPGKIWAANV